MNLRKFKTYFRMTKTIMKNKILKCIDTHGNETKIKLLFIKRYSTLHDTKCHEKLNKRLTFLKAFKIKFYKSISLCTAPPPPLSLTLSLSLFPSFSLPLSLSLSLSARILKAYQNQPRVTSAHPDTPITCHDVTL